MKSLVIPMMASIRQPRKNPSLSVTLTIDGVNYALRHELDRFILVKLAGDRPAYNLRPLPPVVNEQLPMSCDCPYFVNAKQDCKHILAMRRLLTTCAAVCASVVKNNAGAP